MIKRILVLAPHTDDGEFGAGGSVVKFLEEKKEVFYAAFSICEESVPKDMPKNILLHELKKAVQILGIPQKRLYTFRFKVRNFPMHRQQILEEIIGLKRKISPDLVFLPSINDLHQDHKTIAEEGLRAFKDTSILAYEIPWNNITFSNTCCIFLKEHHIKQKIEALKCYKSQYFRKYANEEYFFNLAKIRGISVGAEFAEVFEVMRWII